MKVLRSLLVPSLALLALVLAACAPAPAPTQAPPAAKEPPKAAAPTAAPAAKAPGEPLKIGIVAEFVGPFAANGLRFADTFEWLLQQNGNQIAGRPVQVIRAESQAKVDVFQSETRRLIETQKVDLILGPLNSGIAASAEEWMHQQPTVWVIWEVGTVQYYPGPNAVRSVASSWHHAFPAIGKYMAEKQGIKQAVTIGLDYAAGRDFVEGEVKNVFPAANISLAKQFWVPVGSADFGPVISQIPTGQDVWITGALWSADAVRFMQQATDFGLKSRVKMIAFPAAFAVDDVGMDTLGSAAEGMYVYNEMPAPDFPHPEYQKFVTAYKQKFGVPPGYSSKAYVTYLQVKQAIESLNGRTDDRQALVRALRQPLDVHFDKITFDECGNAVRSLFLKQIKMVEGKAQTSQVAQFPDARIPCPRPKEWKS